MKAFFSLKATASFLARHWWIPAIVIIVFVNATILAITGPEKFPSGLLLVVSGIAGLVLGWHRTREKET